MASLVLLDSYVELCFKEEDGEASAVAAEKKGKGVVAAAPTLQSLDSTISFLRSLTPEALLHQPPKVSMLRLRSSRPVRDAPEVSLFAVVACADKSMLVLYGGNYGGPGYSGRGCYLIYDAAVSGVSTLTSTVPSLPLSCCLTCVGAGAVALRSHPPSSSYVLAELVTTAEHRFPDAEIYLWRSDSPAAQWEKRVVRLPPQVCSAPGRHDFSLDISFSFGTSGMCWVDLLRGIVLYHHDHQQDPQFRFIPLPDGCPEYDTSHYPYRPRMPEFRNAACVAGAIKFVSLEGYLEGWNCQQFRFVTWTLTPDLGQWKKGAVFHLKDIWASDMYLALNIPQNTPILPVLSPLDDGAVYVIVNNVEVQDIVKGFEVVETKVDIKGQYVLGLDIQGNRVISADGGRPASNTVDLWPKLLATDFCACLQGLQDHQRDVEASEVAEGKEAEGLLISATHHVRMKL